MEQFSLEKWLENKSRKVVTRDGREVDLYYSPTSRIPLIGATTSDNEIHQYTKDGFQCDTINQAKNDLFFADEEEVKPSLIKELEEYFKNTPKEQIEKDWQEIQDWYNQHCIDKSNNEEKLTEFEKEVSNLINFYGNEVEETTVTNAGVKEIASKLLDLARKELEKSNVIIDKDKYIKNCDYYYEQGKQNALRTLPKWKKTKKDEELDCHVAIQQDDRVVLSDFVQKDEYYITLDVLKTLPKEE